MNILSDKHFKFKKHLNAKIALLELLNTPLDEDTQLGWTLKRRIRIRTLLTTVPS